MPRPPLENIDPLHIYMNALGFHVSEDILGRLTLGPDMQLASQVTQPNIVLSAFTSELFFKCLICIETKLTPQGHHLDDLFEQLNEATKREIIHLWETKIVPLRDPQWKVIEADLSKGSKFCRDLPGALEAGRRTFERMRYHYEPASQIGVFNLGDLPRILRRVILQKKPEWANLVRDIKKIGEGSSGQ